jgi:hypothetical protein
MVPWEFAAVMLPIGFLAGFGLKVLVDYAELASYRRLAALKKGQEPYTRPQ